MLLRQLSYAIKNQLKAALKAQMPPTRGISCLSLVIYGISQDPPYLSFQLSEMGNKGGLVHPLHMTLKRNNPEIHKKFWMRET